MVSSFSSPSLLSPNQQPTNFLQPRKRPPPPPPPPQPSLPAPSPLAAKNHLSASSEAEIRTAFSIFSTTSSSSPPSHDHSTNTTPTDTHASATMPTSALSRALAALDCGPRSAAEKRQLTESVDPANTGEVRYEDFVALAALQLRRRRSGRGRGVGRNKDEEDGDSEDIRDEVEAAFRLFLEAGGEESGGKRREGEERITIRGLRRVAKELGNEGGGGGMGEDVLRNMIMEANGLGPDGVGRGVGRAEFADVMRRAGVF